MVRATVTVLKPDKKTNKPRRLGKIIMPLPFSAAADPKKYIIMEVKRKYGPDAIAIWDLIY